VIQGSPEWLQARCGNATASEFVSILAKGQGKMRAAYLRRIVAERLTGKPSETYRNAHMDRGTEQQPLARDGYEEHTGNLIQEVGFIKHPELAAGCSPDGLVGADGGGEFKCVIPTVQLDTILSGSYPSEHKAQVQGCLWITGRKWWDFCSYSPDFTDERLRLYIFRVERDEEYIAKLEREVRGFLLEADYMVDCLLGRDSLEARLRASLEAA
jgi:hypothetical protein